MFCFLLSDQTVKLTQLESAKEQLQVDLSTGTDEANSDSINLQKNHMLCDHTNVALLSYSLGGLSLPVLFWFLCSLCFSSFFSCQHKKSASEAWFTSIKWPEECSTLHLIR